MSRSITITHKSVCFCDGYGGFFPGEEHKEWKDKIKEVVKSLFYENMSLHERIFSFLFLLQKALTTHKLPLSHGHSESSVQDYTLDEMAVPHSQCTAPFHR